MAAKTDPLCRKIGCLKRKSEHASLTWALHQKHASAGETPYLVSDLLRHNANHPVPASCIGERCGALTDTDGNLGGVRCGKPAMHKIAEEILPDDPKPLRHEFTQYVCCNHFCIALGLTIFDSEKLDS